MAADESYNLHSKSEMYNLEIYRAFLRFQDAIDFNEYKIDLNDCDDYARLYSVFLRNWYINKVKKEKGFFNLPAYNIPVGEVLYIVDKKSPNDFTTGHAVNIVVYTDNNELKYFFIEPQTGDEKKLSEDELKSIYSITF